MKFCVAKWQAKPAPSFVYPSWSGYLTPVSTAFLLLPTLFQKTLSCAVLEFEFTKRAGVRQNVADIGNTRQIHYHAFKAKSEPAVRRSAVSA